MVLAVTMVMVGAALTSAAADWSEDQTPATPQLWRADGPGECPEVFFIGMRGSGQNGAAAGPLEFGSEVELLYRRYAQQIHAAPIPGAADGARAAPVPTPGYRAVPAVDWVDLLDLVGGYWDSVDEGATAVVTTMKKAAKRCGPDTRFILAGFSQGAQAVTTALPGIPKRLRARVDAVLLVASPIWRGDQDIAYFGHGDDWAGSLTGFCAGACGGEIELWAEDVTAALCGVGDAICTGVGLFPIHATYSVDDMDELAAWAVDRTQVAVAIPRCDGRRATHVGSSGSDTIKGTRYRDVVVARAGDDTITTFGGEDWVCAGDGADTVASGSGKDRIWGGRGADTIEGGAGRDWIWGQAGADGALAGGGDDDVIRGGGADDHLAGGNGHDLLVGGRGTDSCDGGAGADDVQTCEAITGE